MATKTPARLVDFLKRVLVGRRLATDKAEHQLLPKFLALPVFSSDPLSSVAYATEEMMLVLVAAGAGALVLKIPIGIAIATLLLIVITSYRQTVRAYPRGGGSYIVARENLGTIPGLTAAAAILSDYVLTVSVSVTAGTVAITSAAPSLADHKVLIAIGFVTLVTIANLRGTKEAGTVFAIPTYGFVALMGITIIVGFVRCLGGCPTASTAALHLEEHATISVFLILKAFSSGATALTGVEAIADGVQAFRPPPAKNAATTLAIMGAMAVSMFLGITVLAQLLRVRISEEIASTNSVLSQITETIHGRGLIFFLVQGFTAGILILAANTAFQDFPRLSSILARDRFMPSQFRNRGDRLVFSNGVVFLAVLASLLIYVFDANLTRLIQLYVVGVFTAFTLSQSGMVRRWVKLKQENWKRGAVINGIGAATTGVVLVIVTLTKFRGGAWIVITAMPVIITFFLAVHRHYDRVARVLRARNLSAAAEAGNSFIVVVRDMGLATADAISYLRALRPERVEPMYTGPADAFEETAAAWSSAAPRLGVLRPLRGAEEHPIRALRAYIRAMPREADDFVTVVIPEQLSGRSWWQFIKQRASLLLKASLFFEPGVVVTDIPLLPQEVAAVRPRAERPMEPERSVVLIPVSAVHDATVRAIVYARSLRPVLVEALFFETDPGESAPMIDAWTQRQIDVPLSIVDAPFRDLGEPLLREVRSHTKRGDTIVTAVLPEFVVSHWWQNLLHNQTALYMKRLLLFEPDVVVTSVPYHLDAPRAGAHEKGVG